MAFDGIVLNAVENELEEKLIGTKIDRVNQPEKDELIINIRGKGENYKLLLSASSNNPRAHLTTMTKPNPMSPPMFCMLLRKHLQGGIITDIRQIEMERILVIEIESMDELGYKSKKDLVIEIMSKHSNIILVRKDDSQILDSIKRIPASTSSVRQVLPGLKYEYPPSQDKVNPLAYEFSLLPDTLKLTDRNLKLFKFLYFTFLGMSPLIAREIAFRANLDSDKFIYDLDEADINNLSNTLSEFYSHIKNDVFSPTIVRDPDTSEVTAFSAVELHQFTGFQVEKIDSISSLLEKFFTERDNQDRIKQKSSDLRKSISTKLERLMNKTAKQELELRESKDREKYRIKGELLTANLYKVGKGDREIIVDNFYSEDFEKMSISLDPKLSPADNAQKYFKRYNKLKHADNLLTTQIEQSREEIEYLDNIIFSIDNSTEITEIDEIREELIKENYLKSYHLKNRKQKQESSKPHHYESSDGFDIYVGKNNKQNDYLTLRFANRDDYWFHTKDIPGSHVIIKSDGREITETAIKEAALLASYYSKGKMSSNVAVDYTEKKNVRKPSGAKPGMVIYENNSTIYITPERSEVIKIKKVC